MVKIILIRPGSTEFDKQGRILGTLDVPLSDEGNAEVESVIGQIGDQPVQLIYASPSESAEQTAHRVAESLRIKCKKVDKLKNIDHGLWQGMLVEDVRRKQPRVFKKWQEQPETVCPPQGEMLSDARHRVEGCVAKILKKHKSGTIGLVAPEPLASLISSVLKQTEVRESWQTKGSCGSWEEIDIEPAALSSA